MIASSLTHWIATSSERSWAWTPLHKPSLNPRFPSLTTQARACMSSSPKPQLTRRARRLPLTLHRGWHQRVRRNWLWTMRAPHRSVCAQQRARDLPSVILCLVLSRSSRGRRHTNKGARHHLPGQADIPLLAWPDSIHTRQDQVRTLMQA